nr:hypothetical protein CFP56_68555 [Quercus suber]
MRLAIKFPDEASGTDVAKDSGSVTGQEVTNSSKCNDGKLDGAMFPKSNEAGVGVVIRNEAGEVLAALAFSRKDPSTIYSGNSGNYSRAGLVFPHPIFKGDSEVIIKSLLKIICPSPVL